MVNDELVTTCKSRRFSNKDLLWKQPRHLSLNPCTFKYILHLTFVLDQFYFHSFHQMVTRGWGVRVDLPQSKQETELKLSKPWQMSVCFIKYVSQRKQRGRDNPRQDFLNTEYQHGQMTEWRGEMCNVSHNPRHAASVLHRGSGTFHGDKLRNSLTNQLGRTDRLDTIFLHIFITDIVSELRYTLMSIKWEAGAAGSRAAVSK